MEGRSTFIASTGERGTLPRFWTKATVLAVTVILLSLSHARAQQGAGPARCDLVPAGPHCPRVALPLPKGDTPKRDTPKIDTPILCGVNPGLAGCPRSPQQAALDRLYQAGMAAMNAAQWDAAIANFTKLVDTDPNYREASFAFYSIGLSYNAKLEFARAVPFFDKAIAKEPGMAMAYQGRGEANFELGNRTGALADLNWAIALNPKQSFGYAARARQKMKDRDMDGALADLDRAIELNPKDSRSLFGRSLIRRVSRNYDLALADLSKAIEIDPRYSAAYTQRGLVYVLAGQPEQARDSFNAALKLNPGDTRARQGLDALSVK